MIKYILRTIIKIISLPEMCGVDLDSEKAVILHSMIIRNKPLLRSLYTDFYNMFKERLADKRSGLIVELGSGGGFIKEVIPEVKTSDITSFKYLDLHFSALDMPFKDSDVDAFLMFDVLHHIGSPKRFFTEASRCLKPGGRIIMIEPSNTLSGGFCNKYLHHERYEPKGRWNFKDSGRMTSTNLALPWILFFRDRIKFLKMYPEFKITTLQHHTPFRYLISGGLSTRQLMPSFMDKPLKLLEKIITPLNDYLGMFVTVELEKF